jgi:catechol 2,3-dioxygenase-like lactoylglutathione lyase family enzyme
MSLSRFSLGYRKSQAERTVLATAEPMLFLATDQPDRSRDFYARTLGLTLLGETPFALVFHANGTDLRVQKVSTVVPAPYTAAGWAVPDIAATVAALHQTGVAFQRYDGLDQDAQGIWTAPGGARVAWFKDPCGNTLSLTQRG